MTGKKLVVWLRVQFVCEKADIFCATKLLGYLFAFYFLCSPEITSVKRSHVDLLSTLR